MAATDFLTEEQLQAMMEQRFGVPEGTARSSPLDFQYQNEEYPDPITHSRLYNQREGMFSPKMQTQDQDAYYENVQALGPNMMGWDDPYGPLSKPEDRWDPYVQYQVADQPGGDAWQHNYVYDSDKPRIDETTNPMLMEALIRQKQSNLHGIPQTLGFSEEITPSGTVAEELIDENRIPGRIQESVPNSQNWFEGMMTGAGEGIDSLKNKISSGWDSVSGGLNSLMDNTMLGRIGAMRNATNPRAGNYNPALQGQIDFMKEQGAYGNDWDQSGLNKITGGRLAGKNLQSLFGSNDLMDMYGNDLARLEKTLGNLPKQWSQLMKNNPAAYANKVKTFKERIAQNKWEQEQATKDLATRNRIKLGSNLYQDKNYKSDPKLSKIGKQKYTGKGMAFEKQKSGTFTTPSGKTGYSGGRRDGGRVGYGNGGLATLFARRG